MRKYASLGKSTPMQDGSDDSDNHNNNSSSSGSIRKMIQNQQEKMGQGSQKQLAGWKKSQDALAPPPDKTPRSSNTRKGSPKMGGNGKKASSGAWTANTDQSDDRGSIATTSLNGEGGGGGGGSTNGHEDGDGRGQRKMNPFYADVAQTGRWGTVGRYEKYVAAMIASVAIVAALLILFGVVLPKDEEVVESLLHPGQHTAPPTPSPTNRPSTTPRAQLEAIRAAVEENQFTLSHLDLLPLPDKGANDRDDFSYYLEQAHNASAPPQVRAASWIMFEDERKEVPTDAFFVSRYALAVIYYHFGGEDWIKQVNWMSDEPLCNWFGAICNFQKTYVSSLELPHNGLSGRGFPAEINLLRYLVAVVVSGNQITGPLDGLLLGTLERLAILYVDDNQFTGTVSADLMASGTLHTLFVQQNDFQGFFSRSFCLSPGDTEPPLKEFGLDCDDLKCFCCAVDGNSGVNNCF